MLEEVDNTTNRIERPKRIVGVLHQREALPEDRVLQLVRKWENPDVFRDRGQFTCLGFIINARVIFGRRFVRECFK